MKHYETIQGWFNCPELYTEMVNRVKDSAKFVEIGCWKGKSSSYMAEEIKNSNKNIRFYCIDTWEGTLTEDGHQQDPDVIAGTLYQKFLDNMKPFLYNYSPLRMKSVDAAKIFKDGSLDFIYIDAGHEYQDVITDIEAWLPKLKPGGVIAGDDYVSKNVHRAVHEKFKNVKSPNYLTWVVYT